MTDLVVLAAHGAGDGSEANRKVVELSRIVADRIGAEVRASFWKGSPSFTEVARHFAGRAAWVVPVMASGGYYASLVLPERLSHGDPTGSFRLTPALGTLPMFTAVALKMVDEVRSSAFRASGRPAVLVVGHGTTRVGTSGNVAREVARILAAAYRSSEVLTAFLDQPPYLEDAARSLRDRPLLVVPLLMGGGAHVRDDILSLFAVEPGSRARRRAAPIEVLPPVLDWPELPSLVLEALDAARARAPALPTAAGARAGRGSHESARRHDPGFFAGRWE